MSVILKAAGCGDISRIEELIHQINIQNKKGLTAIHCAISESQIETVKFLVENDADLNIKEKKNGFTPLMLCLAEQPMDFLTMIEIILEGKPDLRVQDSLGQSALHLSVQYELEDCTALLLEAGAPTDIQDKKGLTPLHVAAARGNFSNLNLLIENKAIINVLDNEQNSALHWVVMSESENGEDLVKLLLDRGTKITPNAEGDTPLHCEAHHCDPEKTWPSAVATLLIERSSELELMKNNLGQTPVDIYNLNVEEINPSNSLRQEAKEKSKKQSKKREVDEDIENTRNAAKAAKQARMNKGKKNKKEKIEELEEANVSSRVIILGVLMGFLAVLYALFTQLESKS